MQKNTAGEFVESIRNPTEDNSLVSAVQLVSCTTSCIAILITMHDLPDRSAGIAR